MHNLGREEKIQFFDLEIILFLKHHFYCISDQSMLEREKGERFPYPPGTRTLHPSSWTPSTSD
jgi:hypothetical protein